MPPSPPWSPGPSSPILAPTCSAPDSTCGAPSGLRGGWSACSPAPRRPPCSRPTWDIPWASTSASLTPGSMGWCRCPFVCSSALSRATTWRASWPSPWGPTALTGWACISSAHFGRPSSAASSSATTPASGTSSSRGWGPCCGPCGSPSPSRPPSSWASGIARGLLSGPECCGPWPSTPAATMGPCPWASRFSWSSFC